MSAATQSRISGMLTKEYDGLIDMSDWATRPEADRKNAFLSRALAALCVKGLARTDYQNSAASITDGFGDNGIDAAYFDQQTDTLFLVQSKWSSSGTTPIPPLTSLYGFPDLRPCTACLERPWATSDTFSGLAVHPASRQAQAIAIIRMV